DKARLKSEESRQRLVQIYVANGVRLMDADDLFHSLSWFVEALRLDEGTPSEATDRARIGVVLQQYPKLTQMGFHGGHARSAAFSRDGARIVTTAGGNTAQVWSVATDRAVTPPLAHRDTVNTVEFSPDGRRVITASDDHTARVW